jgi:hypothetical protein
MMNFDPSRTHFGLVVPPVVLGLVALAVLPSPGPYRLTDLELSPERAFPLQEVAINGVPDDLAGFPLRAVPLDADGQVRGDTVPLYAVRLEGREPAFVAPPHPAGPDAIGRFRIEPEGLTPSTPLVLTIEPLPAEGGQTLRLLANLSRIVEAMARAAGGDPDLLRDGPIEEVPLNLLGAAAGLRVVATAESELAGRDLTWSDRWLAARQTPGAVEGFADSLAGLADRIGELPERPPEASDDKTEAADGDITGAVNRRANAIGDAPSFANRTREFAPGPYRLANTGVPPVSHPAPSIRTAEPSTPRGPWEKVDICSRCPGELDYWMNLQAELAQGYGGLLERMARDRNLFDFMSSLDAPSDEDTRAFEGHLSKAADRARKAAGNPLADLKTPDAKRGLALAEAVKGVFELTIGLNDKFLISLLPSELLPASVSVNPRRFNEDDTRAELDGPGAGTWTLRVTARSDEVTFSTSELMDYFSSLKSIVGNAEQGVFGTGDDGGLCAPSGATQGTGEAACELVGEVVDRASKTLGDYEKARDRAGLGPGDAGLPDPDSELITHGPYVWVGIDVSEPKWSAARPVGSCVRVVARDHPSQESQWSLLSYLPQDPASSWGAWADRRIPPEMGIKPAAVGDCGVRISTRVDRFGDATPLHLDVPVGVDAIRVLVTPSPITVEPGEVRRFEPTVQFADSVDVGWSEQSGSGTEVPCPSGENGRPCYRWTAPELDVGECRRPVRITATSLARRGLRESGEPVREGFGAVQVVDPNADLRVTMGGSPVEALELDPKERVIFEAEGPAATGGIEWTATGGSISGIGRRATYVAPRDPGTYRITASSPRSENCEVSVMVTVPETYILLEPAAACVAPGDTLRFVAKLVGLRDGARQEDYIRWSSTGGSIDRSGLYRAPSGEGEYKVTATYIEDEDFEVTAQVSVGGDCCGFTATVSAGLGAGPHAGTAHLLGNGLVLRDAGGEWKALVELPGKDPGRYETAMSMHVLVPHPYQPDMMAWAWADAPDGRQEQPATVIVERTEGDLGMGRANGFIEGRVEGRGGWRSNGGNTYFVLSARFKAVPYAVSPRSRWQQCREAWGLTSSGDLLRQLEP